MNTISIKSNKDYIKKMSVLKYHGVPHDIDGFIYRELCPCTVEIDLDCIDEITKNFLKRKKFDGTFDEFKLKFRSVIYEDGNFRDIENSEYIGKDYKNVRKSFTKFLVDTIDEKKTRRQFSYQFNEELCMNAMQIFEDRKLMIVYFRSCDYIKKLPLDLYLIKTLVDDYNVHINKIYCMFGSLHAYDEDKI